MSKTIIWKNMQFTIQMRHRARQSYIYIANVHSARHRWKFGQLTTCWSSARWAATSTTKHFHIAHMYIIMTHKSTSQHFTTKGQYTSEAYTVVCRARDSWLAHSTLYRTVALLFENNTENEVTSAFQNLRPPPIPCFVSHLGYECTMKNDTHTHTWCATINPVFLHINIMSQMLAGKTPVSSHKPHGIYIYATGSLAFVLYASCIP